MSTVKITISEYDASWPELFCVERDLLMAALGKSVATIEHIGSTSVPDLAAKSIIDIMIGLHDFGAADSLVPKIVALGYHYVDKYEDVMPFRRFFLKPSQIERTHHIHMVEVDSDFWNDHLLFRDYLRANKPIAKEYESLKKTLVKRRFNDTNDFADAKSDFIGNILKEAKNATK